MEKIITGHYNTVLANFYEHLNNPKNNRILFSGAFGTGKTTFIDHFFSEQIQKDIVGDVKYKVVHLFPVNYSIASNEDILNYLKHDIVIEFLKQNFPVEDGILESEDLLSLFILKNIDKIIISLVAFIPKIGKNLSEGLTKMQELKKDFDKESNLSKRKASEGNELSYFLEEIQNEEKGLFENNIITQIIKDVLNRIKQETNHVETVLVIDDLDRIDPEHIFRILNIFAAHLDINSNDSGPNKFGFDKIIVVCDVNNLRNIFSAKYGSSTDFNGYIDKFYSYKIFYYDNNEYVNSIYLSVFQNNIYQTLQKSNHQDYKYIKTLTEGNFISKILQNLVRHNEMNLRQITKWLEKPIIFKNDLSTKMYGGDNDVFFALLVFLSEILGDYKLLTEKLNKLRGKYIESTQDDFYNVVKCLHPLSSDRFVFYHNGERFSCEMINYKLSISITDNKGHTKYEELSALKKDDYFIGILNELIVDMEKKHIFHN